MRWRALYAESKPRHQHAWEYTDQQIWVSLCGIKMPSYLVLSKAYGEDKCEECELKLIQNRKVDRPKK